MNAWIREHKTSMGIVRAMVTKQKDSYQITALEPSGINPHIKDIKSADTLEEGQREADDDVQREHPHDCAERQCGEWEERGQIIDNKSSYHESSN